MRKCLGSISLFTDQYDSIVWEAGNPCSFLCFLNKSKLRDEQFCFRVLELKGKLFGCICWVRRREGTARPERSPDDGAEIRRIRRIRRYNIAGLPLPRGLERLAELY